MYSKVLNYFEDWNLFEKMWLVSFTVLGTWLCVHWGDTPIGIISFLTNIWCVILVTKGKILNYPIGIVGILTYAYVAYNRQLYGDVQLNLIYYLPMSFYGWWIWSKKQTSSAVVKVKFLSWKQRGGVIIAIALVVLFYYMFLKSIGGAMPLKDASTTVMFVVAMFLMARRYMEQWVLWIVGDVIEVVMWFKIVTVDGTNDIGALLMWSAFLINAIYGLYNWTKLHKSQQWERSWKHTI